MNMSESRQLIASYKSLIINMLKRGTYFSADLQKEAGISLQLLETILNKLVQEHIIYEKDGAFSLNTNYINSLCIAIHRDANRIYLRYRIYNAIDEIRAEKEMIKKKFSINDVYDIIDTVMVSYSHIRMIGISMPGVIEDGFVHSTSLNRQDEPGFNMKELLRQRYSQDIILENDANTAAAGFYVRESDYNNIALIFQPVMALAGIGIVINGQLITGKNHLAGEAQYMPIAFSKKNRIELCDSPEGFEELITKYVQNLIATINPDAVGIACKALKDYHPVIEHLKKVFPYRSDLPELITIEDMTDDSLIGLRVLCKEAYEKEHLK